MKLSKKTITKIGAVAALFVIAPPLGLWAARDANSTSQISATNAVVGATAQVAPIAPKVIHNDFAGVLLPPKMANLAPQSEGRVEAVIVKVGQHVRQGDVLLRFDPRQKKQDLAMATAAMRAAQASAGAAASEMAAASRRAARRNATVTVGGQAIALVSGEEAAQAQSDARTAAARAGSAGASIAEAQARVASLRLALEDTEVKAPFDGIVTALLFEPGMNVHANESVARVVGGGSGLRLRFAVAEEDVAVLQNRRRARITLEHTTLFATIDQVSPEVEPASRMFVVEGPVDGGDAACGPAGCAMVAGRGVRVALEEPAPGMPAAPVAQVAPVPPPQLLPAPIPQPVPAPVAKQAPNAARRR